MQKIMDVLGISFMIIIFFYVLHLWFATLAVSGLRNIYEIFMSFFYALHVCCLCFFFFTFAVRFVRSMADSCKIQDFPRKT